MSILSSEHLFEQAERLIEAPFSGPPRQVDLRRAISSAYYGLFHFILTSVADEFIGVTQRSTSRYVLVYRSVDHRTLREFCVEAQRSVPTRKYAAYVPPSGMESGLQAFATATIDLQEKRHRADYNPQPRFRTSDAKLAIGTARTAIERFEACSKPQQKVFLTLLLFPPR